MSDTVRIRISWGSFANERDATRGIVQGIPVFVHPAINHDPATTWTVTEAETGCAMGHGPSPEAAIAHAEECMESAGGVQVVPELRRAARFDGRACLEIIG
jgi:hypothetical protein